MITFPKVNKYIKFPWKQMCPVNTLAGEITLVAEASAECPWCRNESVWLCRETFQGQWVPIVPSPNTKGVYELHRCEDAVKVNNALRRHLQMKEIVPPWLTQKY